MRGTRFYQIQRGNQLTSLALCERHLEARKILGWTANRGRKLASPGNRCCDCSRTEPTVLERIVDATEKPEPKATPVDVRQKRLL